MSGRLVRIAGPTVVAEGLGGAGLNEVVWVGEERLLGEVIRIEGDRATIQVYEETAGLALGEPAEPTGRAARGGARAGPARRRSSTACSGRSRALAARAGGLPRARRHALPALDRARRWRFEPRSRGRRRARAGRSGSGSRARRARRTGAGARAAGRGGARRGGAPRARWRVDDPVVRLEGGGTLALAPPLAGAPAAPVPAAARARRPVPHRAAGARLLLPGRGGRHGDGPGRLRHRARPCSSRASRSTPPPTWSSTSAAASAGTRWPRSSTSSRGSMDPRTRRAAPRRAPCSS